MVSNHDELMSNFFAQADALAVGKTPVELRSENVPDALIPHKTFTGNRPSSSLMLPDLSAYTTGQILALYEHNTAVMVRRQGDDPRVQGTVPHHVASCVGPDDTLGRNKKDGFSGEHCSIWCGQTFAAYCLIW